jgi:hypothetical protein
VIGVLLVLLLIGLIVLGTHLQGKRAEAAGATMPSVDPQPGVVSPPTAPTEPALPQPETPAVIPTPQPAAEPALTMGASWFCHWAKENVEFEAVPGIQCPYPNTWASLATPDRKMLLSTPGMAPGTYDESDPAITLQRIAFMEQGGLAVASVQIEFAHEHTCPSKLPSWRKRLPPATGPLLMGHCAENWPADAKVKYYLSFWDVMAGDPIWGEMKGDGWTAADVEDSWRQLGDVIARHALKASYFAVGGRPVFQRGWAHNTPFYEREFGVTPKRITEILREEVRKTTGKELYIISTCTEEATWPLTKEWGWDAVTQYALLGNDWANAASNHRLWWDKGIAFAKSSGMDFWVPTSCGYDSRAWNSPEKCITMPTILEFIAHIKEARAFARANFRYTRGICWNYAFSEHGEGGILEPMADIEGNLHRGDEMLRAHAEACR